MWTDSPRARGEALPAAADADVIVLVLLPSDERAAELGPRLAAASTRLASFERHEAPGR